MDKRMTEYQHTVVGPKNKKDMQLSFKVFDTFILNALHIWPFYKRKVKH